MRSLLERMRAFWHAETWLLASVFVAAALLLIFGFMADEVMDGSTTALDQAIILSFRSGSDNLSGPIGPPWVREMARDITSLGSIAVLGIMSFVVVAYLILAKSRAAALLVLVAVLGGLALNSLLKIQFARPRPDLFIPAAKVFTASFPSGHAAYSAITYMTLAALLARTTESRRLRIYFVAVAVTLTFMIGISRVYLGVHYPTDVLAGWCVGSAWALLCWAIMTRLQHKRQIEPPRDR
ncbi:phosphatase PAP2 family protein [Bradyrhizobium sp.]|uniref:phosphatase PAP2 family protein n=1 Tax=Bradyrhizobium sp. TaxID=376 RepID=UPI002DF73B91|nr:phosphatase PAP2 family protein [Bradyrhizobium sp.]